MRRVRGQEITAAAAVVLLAAIVAVVPPLHLLQGWSIDILTALRWRAFGNTFEPSASHAVVVALDEESYRTPPFKGSPTIVWTNEIGRVLTGIVEAGAHVIGMDAVFPTSIEQSEIPFGDATLGERLRGFDRDFLRAQARIARAGKLVLGEILGHDAPIMPTPGQRIAVGQGSNIRALNVYSDSDEVVRRVPLTFIIDGQRVPSLSLELAARALGIAPMIDSAGVALADYRVRDSVPNTITLNFAGGSRDIPTYSLADLHACLEKGDHEFFHRNFNGKVVLFGVVLDLEDRKITSKRFATEPEQQAGERCALPLPRGNDFTRQSIGGTYVHATAVNNLLRRDGLLETTRLQTGLIAALLATVAASAALLLSPAAAVCSFVLVGSAWTAGSVVAMQSAVALPLLPTLLAGLVALCGTLVFRLAVTDKHEMFLRRSFGLYLAPAVIERMVKSSKLPSLGGETRTVTIFFSDVANFTSFAESMAPSNLVTVMNAYLSAMTEIIEEHGGFVDKYIGDAIVGVFGAPAADQDHATNAVRAALACCAKLAELNCSGTAFAGHRLSHRIGLNSGQALVGNIGSRRRFNYTALGTSVNLASRFEGANKYFGTSILASEATVSLTGAAFQWREIDTIRVTGYRAPLRVYEPLAETGTKLSTDCRYATIYSRALMCWRQKQFAEAAELFASIAENDPPAAIFASRAKAAMYSPPGADWEPVYTLEGK
jgi:class 3 adenylate cyclase/CHASE2 domain-containing sensor protein